MHAVLMPSSAPRFKHDLLSHGWRWDGECCLASISPVVEKAIPWRSRCCAMASSKTIVVGIVACGPLEVCLCTRFETLSIHCHITFLGLEQHVQALVPSWLRLPQSVAGLRQLPVQNGNHLLGMAERRSGTSIAAAEHGMAHLRCQTSRLFRFLKPSRRLAGSLYGSVPWRERFWFAVHVQHWLLADFICRALQSL